jgi:integrase
MKRILTDTTVRNAKPKPDGKPAKHTDGGGLYLLVNGTGKYWRYNYIHGGKQKTLAVGVYPDTSLKQARDAHDNARKLLAQGIDPSAHKQEAKAAQLALSENSFELVAREWHKKFSPQWSERHAGNVIRRFEHDFFPFIGNRPIADLEPPDILKCLRRIEERGAIDTAHRAKTDCGSVFRYAVATGKATRDPTPDLKGALPPQERSNFAAITEPQEVGKLLRAIAGYFGDFKTVAGLQLSAYLFQRPGEVRKMEWSEINFETSLWEIPAERMKKRKAHLVPLSRQALAILEELRPLTGRFKYVFPSRTNVNKPMGANTLVNALHKLGYTSEEMTAHGFRSLASTRLYEMGFHADIIEKQLAHLVGSDVRRAYDRSQFIEQRTTMMQQWADYLDSLRDGAQIIPIRRAG